MPEPTNPPIPTLPRIRCLRSTLASAAPLSRGIAALAFCVVLSACGQSSRPPVLTQAEHLASNGDFAAAAKLIEANRFKPQVAAHLAETAKRIARYREMHGSVDGELRAFIAQHGENKALLHARKRAGEEASAGRTFLAQVWRKRMSAISEIAKTVERVPTQLADGTVPQDATPEAIGHDWTAVLAEIDGLVDIGEFRSAVDRVRGVMPTAGEDADLFRRKLWEIQKQGKAAIEGIVTNSESIRKDKGNKVALTYLASEARRFPEFGVLGGVEQARRRLMKAMGRAGEITWGPGQGVGIRSSIPQAGEAPKVAKTRRVAPILRAAPTKPEVAQTPESDTGSRYRARRSLDESAQEAFEARNYTRAREDWLTAVKFSEGLEAEKVFAARAAEAGVLADCIEELGRQIADNPKRFRRVDLGNGTIAALQSIHHGRLVAKIRGQVEEVALAAVPDVALADLVVKFAKSPLHELGAAALYARAFDKARAEKILVSVIRREEKAKPQVDRLLSVIRKEDPGPGGYVLEGSSFVSSRAIARRELRAKYRGRINALWRASDKEQFLGLTKAFTDEGAKVGEILIDALRDKRRELADRLDKSKAGAQLDKLFVDRKALEDRRIAALDLIFDAGKYFYPYKPPAVSGEKAGEYAEVQLEVTRLRVGVQEVWTNLKRRVSLGGKLAKSVQLYAWIDRALRWHTPSFQSTPNDRWLFAFPSDGVATIQTVARNAAERKFLDLCYRVLATNKESYAKMRSDKSATGAEIDLMQRTNAYRMQMGRRPLRADARIVLAARGHCEEMSRLGYFGHMSPTPGRRTPGDRMRLAGYTRGAGENLAVNASPAGAIAAWQRSSGHHRNMLSSSHRDIGGGVHGRHFNQNFGSGQAK